MRLELTSISQSKSSEPDGKPEAPDTLKWTKPTIFALGLVVAHQKKTCQTGKEQTDWKGVLPVINDIFPREFEGFNDSHPKGLETAAKLRSQYSDHERPRENKWQFLHPDKCTPEEIKEMTRMIDIVFETERRLSQVPGSSVKAPGPNAARWVSFTVKQKSEKTAPAKPTVRKRKRKATSESDAEETGDIIVKSLKTAAKPAVRKRKKRATLESEAEQPGDEEDLNWGKTKDENEQADKNCNDQPKGRDEQGDDDGNAEQENSEDNASSDHNDEEERTNDKHASDKESSRETQGSSSSSHDSEEDCMIVTTRRPRRVVVVDDEDGDAERTSDGEHFMNAADEIRADRKKAARLVHGTARQSHPQYKKSHLNEVHYADDNDEDDEEPAPSTNSQDAFEAGTDGNEVRGFHNVSHDQSVRVEYTADDLVKIRDQFLQPVDDLDLLPPFTSHKTGALDNAIIQSKAAELVGNQYGLQITPYQQTELLRRHRQNEMKALHYDENRSMRLSGLAPPPYPTNPPRVYYGDGHTEHLPQPIVYSYSALRRTLIIAFQARRWTDVMDAIKHVPGFVEGEWNVTTDLIDNIVATTGKSRADVTEAVNIATHRQSISSLKLAKLLALPIKIDKNEDSEPDSTLDNIVQQINAQPKLQMLHTNDIDFTTEPPTYTFRKNTTGSGNDFRFVRSSNSLYPLSGEVRRVLLMYETTGQGKEIDVMLCHKTLCTQCTPSVAETHDLQFEHAEQRDELPLVHHKDVAMFEDEKLYFVPMQQDPALDDVVVAKRDIHEVVFANGRPSQVIFCDKALCGACKPKEVSCVADLVLPWRR